MPPMRNSLLQHCHVVLALVLCGCACVGDGQRAPALPLSINSFSNFMRSKETVPKGRVAKLSDTRILHYSSNGTTWVHLDRAASLLKSPGIDLTRCTVLYAHGYLEVWSDESVLTVLGAHASRGDCNVLLVDWANLAFGNYLAAALDVSAVGSAVSRTLVSLVRRGLDVSRLHLVGHSLGAHLVAVLARGLAAKGFIVPRVTGLDPAYPGFYPAVIGGAPLSAADATFVDVIHTDGGGYGAPIAVGHADFWPNEGRAKQPGCLPLTVPLTNEDFCSHWRSWAYWAESASGGEFIARACADYDTFLRGDCADSPAAFMGIGASPELRGNFYLRTASRSPYALGARGAA